MKVYGQLERAQFENVSSLPSAGIKGRIVFLTSDNRFYIDNGTSFVKVSLTDSDTLTSPVINTGVSGSAIDTDDTLAADSDTLIPSQSAVKGFVDTHTTNTSNPHAVSKSQVGLANVDNTSDADKPISTLTAAALVDKASLTGAEDLSNKTFTDAIILDEQGSTPATPSSGDKKFYAKNDGKLYTLDDAGLEVEVGSGGGGGSGGINYITNPDFETDTTGWVASANITFTRTTTTSEILRGTASGKIAKDASNRQGQALEYSFTVDNADEDGGVLKISCDYDLSSGFLTQPNFSTSFSDVRVRVTYDSGSGVITPTISNIDGSGRFVACFRTVAGFEDYVLQFYVASANTAAWDMFIDNVTVGPDSTFQGTATTDWISDGAIEIDSTITAPTKGTTTTDDVSYKLSGDTAFIRYTYVQTSSGSSGGGSYKIKMPAGLKIDLNKLKGNQGLDEFSASVGFGGEEDSTADRVATAYVFDEDYFTVNVNNEGVGPNQTWGNTDSKGNLGLSSVELSVNIMVPIQGHRSVNEFNLIESTTENTFSAFVSGSNGASAAVESYNIDFIDSVTQITTGDWDITWKSGFFTVAPAAFVSASESTPDDLNAVVGSVTTSGCKVQTSTASTGGDLNKDFYIFVQRQGSDYRSPTSHAISGVDPLNRIAIFEDQKSTNTDAGSSSGGSTVTRTLNTEVVAASFASLSSNQVTVSPGTYKISWSAPCYFGNRHKSALYDETGTATLKYGEASHSGTGGDSTTHSRGDFVTTFSSSKDLEVRHYIQSTKSGNGLGESTNQTGVIEVYARLIIERLS